MLPLHRYLLLSTIYIFLWDKIIGKLSINIKSLEGQLVRGKYKYLINQVEDTRRRQTHFAKMWLVIGDVNRFSEGFSFCNKINCLWLLRLRLITDCQMTFTYLPSSHGSIFWLNVKPGGGRKDKVFSKEILGRIRNLGR